MLTLFFVEESTVLYCFCLQDWSSNETMRDEFEQTVAVGYYGIVWCILLCEINTMSFSVKRAPQG